MRVSTKALYFQVSINSDLYVTMCRDRELCHSTSKSIGDKKDILKSFMAFDITACGSIFRLVVGNRIVVLPMIPPSQ